MHRFEKSDDFLRAGWNMIFRGSVQSKHPFRSPVLGSVEDGLCRMRTVILREADPARRTLLCYTDRRSGKVGQFEADGRVSWHFYHPRKKLQVRARGVMEIHCGDAMAESRWASIGSAGRLDYAAALAPGTPIDTPDGGMPSDLGARPRRSGEGPSAEDLAYAFEQFTVLRSVVHELDLLLLHREGHQRVGATWADGAWTSTWLVP